ncbi:MAG: ribonuclease R [Chlamydiales bacterium]
MKKKSSILIGTIRVHPKGFGFLIPDDRSQSPNDIFIPRSAMKGAVDGDIVKIRVYTQSFSEKGPEGAIVKILKRGRTYLSGVIISIRQKEKIYAYIPLLGERERMRILPSKAHDLKVGDRIMIHVLVWGKGSKDNVGEISAYLGHISDPSCDIQSIIKDFELEDTFPLEALEEARGYGKNVTDEQILEREDLRKLDAFTIDPDGAKDFDDALSITKNKEGEYQLGVHIADVSYYVKSGTCLDQEAGKRCSSVYFPEKVLPMLPYELSSHLCSLKPKVNRLAVSVLMEFNPIGELKSYRITRSVIESKHRFTYKEAKEVLEGKRQNPFFRELQLMRDLHSHLKTLRLSRGSIDFALPDTAIQVNNKGMPTKIEIVDYDVTHQLVEEFMLKTNEIVATHLHQEGKPLTYRIHEEPNPENMKDFSFIAKQLGFCISEQPDGKEIQSLFDQIGTSPVGQFLAIQFIRTMKMASYSLDNIGHYGLGLEHYTHFTSPIRRYIDLVVHRLLFEKIDPEANYEKIAKTSSEKERLANRAENTIILLKKMRFLEKIQKDNPDKIYQAIVVIVKSFGFGFEVAELLLEGFIHEKCTLKIGEVIHLKVIKVNLIRQDIEWKRIKYETPS